VALPQLLARVQKRPAAARVTIDGNRESPTHAHYQQELRPSSTWATLELEALNYFAGGNPSVAQMIVAQICTSRT
jgi:hypothetical protein